MINYTLYRNDDTVQWVTFVHGAGGSSSIWFKQLRDFRKHFNVLLLDLRGHGGSKHLLQTLWKQKYTFEDIANDILEVLDHLSIKKSHFVGISLGTIIIRQLAEKNPERIQSMVLGGAIIKMNFRSQILMQLGNTFKYLLPYLVLYRFFAFVIMPRNNHKQSRLLFVNEAKKLDQKEFIKWFKLTAEINPLLSRFRNIELDILTLYVMGEQDYMFLPSVRLMVEEQAQFSKLFVIKESGHVVNVEQPLVFNAIVLAFLADQK